VSAAGERMVACPACGKPAAFGRANRWRPFCSERCRLADLGGWASESYRIPAERSDDDAKADPGDAPE